MPVRNIRGIGRPKPIPSIHLIPPAFDLIYKLEIVTSTSTLDVTQSLVEGEFTEGITSTVGNFNFAILDPENTISNRVDEFDQVNLYLDYGEAATTLRFSGKIERKSSKDYDFLELSGRNLALNTTGVNVTYNSDGLKARSIILKEIIDKYFSGIISTSGIEDDLGEIEKNYSEVPFWEVVEEICDSGARDAYISPTLVMNYFATGSRKNATECVVEGRNLIEAMDYAKDTEEVITKVKVYGRKVNGIPVLGTSDSDTTVTKGIIKELKIDNANVVNETQAKELADWEFEKNKTLPTLGAVKSLMIPTLAPGEKLVIFSPINNITPEFYEINSYTHMFSRDGAPMTTANIKKPRLNIPEILKKNIRIQSDTSEGDNPNEMESSLIFNFATEDGGTKDDVEIVDGVLKTTSGNSTGTWTSTETVLAADVTAVESRLSGSVLASTQFFVSVDGGNTFTQIAGPNTAEQIDIIGKNIKLKVVLNSETTEITTAALLYKTT